MSDAKRIRRAKAGAPPASDFRISATLPPRNVFLLRVRRAGTYALALVLVTLAVGMVGYHELEDISWLDSFHQSALLLSGMGRSLKGRRSITCSAAGARLGKRAPEEFF